MMEEEGFSRETGMPSRTQVLMSMLSLNALFPTSSLQEPDALRPGRPMGNSRERRGLRKALVQVVQGVPNQTPIIIPP